MPAVVRHALTVALGVIVVDWLTELVIRALPAEDPLLVMVSMLNLFLNVVLFGYGGYLGYRVERVVRAGAEVGVIAAVLAALAAILRQAASPLPDAGPLDATAIIGLLALNITLGGLSALTGALSARRRLGSEK